MSHSQYLKLTQTSLIAYESQPMSEANTVQFNNLRITANV